MKANLILVCDILVTRTSGAKYLLIEMSRINDVIFLSMRTVGSSNIAVRLRLINYKTYAKDKTVLYTDKV